MRLIHPSMTIQLPLSYPKVIRTLADITAVCYNTNLQDKNHNELCQYVQKRINAGHESILEHVSISVSITCDRGISHELVRHRLCAFTQSSTRYINLASKCFENHVTYIIPAWCKNIEPGIYNHHAVFRTNEGQPWSFNAEVLWFNQMLDIENTYKKLVDKHCGGWLPEQARSVLPNSLATIINMTANIREWRHILDLRAFGTTGKPHPQMQQIMLPLAALLHKEYPILFKPANITDEQYETCNPEVVAMGVQR